jgi:hypothetical protein
MPYSPIANQESQCTDCIFKYEKADAKTNFREPGAIPLDCCSHFKQVDLKDAILFAHGAEAVGFGIAVPCRRSVSMVRCAPKSRRGGLTSGSTPLRRFRTFPSSPRNGKV